MEEEGADGRVGEGGGMEDCLRRYTILKSVDNTTKNCIADIGINLLQQMGNHQIDLLGDISGLLSSHPPSPLLSIHHFDKVDPIFPTRDRFESTHHLMSAAEADQSRMLQQTICYNSSEGRWTEAAAVAFRARRRRQRSELGSGNVQSSRWQKVWEKAAVAAEG